MEAIGLRFIGLRDDDTLRISIDPRTRAGGTDLAVGR